MTRRSTKKGALTRGRSSLTPKRRAGATSVCFRPDQTAITTISSQSPVGSCMVRCTHWQHQPVPVHRPSRQPPPPVPGPMQPPVPITNVCERCTTATGTATATGNRQQAQVVFNHPNNAAPLHPSANFMQPTPQQMMMGSTQQSVRQLRTANADAAVWHDATHASTTTTATATTATARPATVCQAPTRSGRCVQ